MDVGDFEEEDVMLDNDNDNYDDSVGIGEFVFWKASTDFLRKVTLFAVLTVAWQHWRRYCSLRCDGCAVAVVDIVVFVVVRVRCWWSHCGVTLSSELTMMVSVGQ